MTERALVVPASAAWRDRWISHVRRLGGMLVSPRRTLRALVTGTEGRVGEIALWLVLLAAAVSPVRTGRAILVGRVAVIDGVWAFLAHLQVRLFVPVVAVLIVAVLLMAASGPRRLSFDRAMDVAGFLLVPVLLLTALGVLLRAGGVDLWFLPHRTLRGGLAARAIYVAVGYGWSLVLLAVALYELRAGGAPADEGAADAPRAMAPPGRS